MLQKPASAVWAICGSCATLPYPRGSNSTQAPHLIISCVFFLFRWWLGICATLPYPTPGVKFNTSSALNYIMHLCYSGGGWGFEFSASAGYKKDTAEMSTDEFLFVISQAECQNYYSMIDLSNPPPFDAGFLAKAKTLADPKVSDEAVLEFIQYYGTHFFAEVTFGAKFVQHHKISQKTYESLSKSKISVEAQASYSGLFSIGGGFSLDKEQSEAASNFTKSVETTTYTVGSTPPSNGDAMTWAASVDQNPVPMLYSLSSIDILFTEPFAKNLPTFFDYNAVRQKLTNASHIYCGALKKQRMVLSCEARFHLESEGVDTINTGISIEIECP